MPEDQSELSDALAMLHGPTIEIEQPRRRLLSAGSEFYDVEDPLYVKLGVHFREVLLAKLRGSKLSVLLCIGLHMDETGEAYPSQATIAEETGYSEREVRDAGQELADMGMITILAEPGKTHRYRVNTGLAMGKNRLPIVRRKTTPAVSSGVPPAVSSGVPRQFSTPEEEPVKEEPLEEEPEVSSTGVEVAKERFVPGSRPYGGLGKLPLDDAVPVTVLSAYEWPHEKEAKHGDSHSPGGPASNVGDAPRDAPDREDQRDHPVPEGGLRAPSGGSSDRDAAIAAFEHRQSAINRALSGTGQAPLGDGDQEPIAGLKHAAWQKPKPGDETALLAACGARWWGQGQKSQAKQLLKGLHQADALLAQYDERQVVNLARSNGPGEYLPRPYFEERLAQARDHHWSVGDLLRALGDLDNLNNYCNRRLRELDKHGNRQDRHGSGREVGGAQSDINLPASWR